MPEVFRIRMKKRRTIVTAILAVCVLTAALLPVLGIAKQNSPLPGPIRFRDFCNSGSQKSGAYVYIEIKDAPYLFAEQTKDKDDYYYCVVTEGDELYIVMLSIPAYQSLILPDYDDPVMLTGVTRYISSDLSEIAIELFVESGWENVGNNTIAEIVGVYYMDTVANPNDPSDYFGFALSLAVLGVLGWFIFYLGYQESKKVAAFYSDYEWEQIMHEYVSCINLLSLNKNKIIMTESYLFNFQNSYNVVRFDEIAWAYRSTYRRTIASASSTFIIVTKSDRTFIINGLLTTGARLDQFEQRFFRAILDKNPAVLIGYSGETRNFAKEMYDIDR
ncbi:MAG: hypothetical protein FWD45_06365 [Coriobacteriia bacterium]|nr:hypothetical protein [Coriobacteriia bacterium]